MELLIQAKVCDKMYLAVDATGEISVFNYCMLLCGCAHMNVYIYKDAPVPEHQVQ